jgi:Ca2+-binding EF-hand superfamily protein
VISQTELDAGITPGMVHAAPGTAAAAVNAGGEDDISPSFQSLDADRDGEITFRELSARNGLMTSQSLLRDYDTNHDGMLSQTEWEGYLMRKGGR